MRTSPNRQARRLFMETLEVRYALDADGFDFPSDPPPPPDPPADSPSADDQSTPPADTPPPAPADDPPPAPADDSSPGPDDPPPDPIAQTPPADPPPVDPNSEAPPTGPPDCELTSSGCIGAPPPNPNPTPIHLTPGMELTNMGEILEAAIRDWSDKMDRDLGQGWVGNITGWGYTCDVVHDFLQGRMTDYMDQAKAQGFVFDNYDFASIYSGGYISYVGGALTQHIYMGIVDQSTGNVVAFADPWRSLGYQSFTPAADDPNVGTISVTPWYTPGTVSIYVPGLSSYGDSVDGYGNPFGGI